MRKLLLTSTGFSNKHIEKLFLQNINKTADKIKVIFVPTAANCDDSKEMLPYCMLDLLNAGILKENILIYELKYLMSAKNSRVHKAGDAEISINFRLLSYDEIMQYDAIYFCGGYSEILLDEINRTGFNDVLKKAVDNGLFYIGVSAGSIVTAGNLSDNLGYIKNELSVHAESGTSCGLLPDNEKIALTNSQAICIEGNKCEIID